MNVRSIFLLVLVLQGGSVFRAVAEESLPLDCGPDSFSIVGVPDTQGYWPKDDQLQESFRFVLEQKARWDASEGRVGCNFVFVTGYGDVVESIYRAHGRRQMEHMSAVYATLQDGSLGIPGNPRIPYHVGTGNHDAWNFWGENDFAFVPEEKKSREQYKTFLSTFPPERFIPEGRGGWNEEPLTSKFRREDRPSSGSPGVNTWQIVSTGLRVDGRPLEFLHLGLEWGWFSLDSKVPAWANARLREHPDLPAFITTHINIAVTSLAPDECGSNFALDEADFFRDIVNENRNVVSVFNGHALGLEGSTPECHVVRKNRAGLDTFQFYNNYQEEGEKGKRGLGYLVFFTFDVADPELRVSVYSKRHGFRDGRRSDGERTSSLRFDFDLLEHRRPPAEPEGPIANDPPPARWLGFAGLMLLGILLFGVARRRGTASN